MAQITVVLEANGKVTAKANPAHADPGDTITWVCVGRAKGLGLRIDFQDGSPVERLESVVVDQVQGTVRRDTAPGLYLYDIFDRDNGKLAWANPISPQQNFGGIEIPRRPPS